MPDVVDSDAKTLVVDGNKENAMGIWPLLASGMMSNQHNNLADLISGLHSAEGHREIVGAVRDEGRHTSDTVHSTSRATELTVEKTAAATNLAVHTGELRLSKEILKESCETRELVRAENQQTRDLIRELDTNRLRDDFRALQAEHLALKTHCCPPCTQG